jgi:hypothetical protein
VYLRFWLLLCAALPLPLHCYCHQHCTLHTAPAPPLFQPQPACAPAPSVTVPRLDVSSGPQPAPAPLCSTIALCPTRGSTAWESCRWWLRPARIPIPNRALPLHTLHATAARHRSLAAARLTLRSADACCCCCSRSCSPATARLILHPPAYLPPATCRAAYKHTGPTPTGSTAATGRPSEASLTPPAGVSAGLLCQHGDTRTPRASNPISKTCPLQQKGDDSAKA